jgi:hypothetical protein
MSRGLGKWQRLILTTITAERPAVWLRDLLPRPCSASNYQALYRAAHVLARAGKICIWTGGLLRSELVLALPGHVFRREHVPRLSVELVLSENRFNTCEPQRGGP